MVEFVNLTKHDVKVFDESRRLLAKIPPSGRVVRVATKRERVGSIGDIPLYSCVFGAVEWLPAPQPNVYYIVSLHVRQTCADRADLLSPGEAVFGGFDNKVGCVGLVANAARSLK